MGPTDMRIALKVAVAATLLALPAAPACFAGNALPADAAHGLAVAERLCSNCHAVSNATESARGDVPPFATIANFPEQTAERLAGKIIIPHPEMPSVQLTMSELRDVVAYILSLRQAK